MKALAAMFDEFGYRTLVGFALAIAAAISGAGALIVAGIWVTWRFWDGAGLPTALIFRFVVWVTYWPALVVLPTSERKNELSIAVISFAVWFVVVALIFVGGRKIRELQGKAFSR